MFIFIIYDNFTKLRLIFVSMRKMTKRYKTLGIHEEFINNLISKCFNKELKQVSLSIKVMLGKSL